MTRREIVYEALAHRETDRLPYRLEFTGGATEKLKAHYGTDDIDAAIGNYILCVYPPWWGFMNPPASFRAEATPDDLPPVQGRGSFEAFGEQLKKLRAETDYYILATIYAFNFEKAWMLRGMENFMVDMIRAPEFVHTFLDRIRDLNLAMLQLLLGCQEIDGFMLGSDWGCQRGLLMKPELWRTFIREREAVCYRLVRQAGKHVWVHSCGNVIAVIPELIQIGLQALNPVQSETMDLQTLKSSFGGRLTFWGGVSTQRTLPYGTPEEVRAEVERVIEIMAPGGGYVLGPAQQIQEDVPLENMLAFIEAARQRG